MSAVEIKFNMPDMAGDYKRGLRELYMFIAAMIQKNRAFLFHSEGSHNGHKKWAGLKFRSGQILSDSGTLRKSIAPSPPRGAPGNSGIVRISSDVVTVGTNLFYARMMNDGTTKMPGGVLRAKEGHALKIPMPSGKSASTGGKSARKQNGEFMFRKSVKIPARPFDDFTTADAFEISAAISNKIAKMMGRK